MATPEQITELRRMIGELENVAPWDNDYVSSLIDASASLNVAAMRSWEQKAALYATMVDTAESGSSRRLSQLQDQALKMAAHYRRIADGEAGSDIDLAGSSYSVNIERR